MPFNNSESKFSSLACDSQVVSKPLQYYTKTYYQGLSIISVTKNTLSTTIFNLLVIYKSHSMPLQQFCQQSNSYLF